MSKFVKVCFSPSHFYHLSTSDDAADAVVAFVAFIWCFAMWLHVIIMDIAVIILTQHELLCLRCRMVRCVANQWPMSEVRKKESGRVLFKYQQQQRQQQYYGGYLRKWPSGRQGWLRIPLLLHKILLLTSVCVCVCDCQQGDPTDRLSPFSIQPHPVNEKIASFTTHGATIFIVSELSCCNIKSDKLCESRNISQSVIRLYMLWATCCQYAIEPWDALIR